jgi:serine/threonine protein kinase
MAGESSSLRIEEAENAEIWGRRVVGRISGCDSPGRTIGDPEGRGYPGGVARGGARIRGFGFMEVCALDMLDSVQMGIQVGDTFGDYRVVGVLGRGGMGKVFRVRSLITDREEAMKVVAPDVDENPELADRFLREIKVHASLVHPNIAALHTALRVGDRIVMILELVEGVSLAETLRGGPLDATTAIRYIDQVLAALEYAHAHGVIHRDIKPANILLTRDGQVKLTDFGIARAATDHRITSTGVALGSLYYMSPEQIHGAAADARSDLYSLGITLYEMVTGRRPIEADSEYSLMNAQITHVPPPPAGVPAALSDAVMKAIAKDPAHRFQSAREFRAELAGSRTTTAIRVWDPAMLERLAALLAPQIGPIAKVVVQRAARAAGTAEELYASLAREIPDEGERKRFLAVAGSNDGRR